MMNQFLSNDQAAQLLAYIEASSLKYEYDYEKHRLIIQEPDAEEPLYFRLPINIPEPALDSGEAIQYIMLLIQAGNCAMGLFEDEQNLDHKVFRSYMVRKKQGKSQIKYLKTKGKSRAGSRVRLGETVEFFENINGRLQEYFEENRIDRIAISCSKTLIPFLFNSRTATPFDKKDKRIFKIPRHVHTPVYEVMMDTQKFLLKGELIFEEEHTALIDELLLSGINDKA